MYELECRYDTRQSFYGKAEVEEQDLKYLHSGLNKVIKLWSYDTLVAEIHERDDRTKYYYFGKYSQTTTRHQKEFFKQFGLCDKQIKELFKNGVLEKEV